jgi:putative solute:sodium symporter small subunit
MRIDRKKRRGVGAMAAHHQHVVAMLRRPVLVMLPVWLLYFFAIKLFAKSLNAITIPVVDMPLGAYLVIQGSVVAFAVILVLLTRAHAATSRT